MKSESNRLNNGNGKTENIKLKPAIGNSGETVAEICFSRLFYLIKQKLYDGKFPAKSISICKQRRHSKPNKPLETILI